jgi:hypothetical protein
MRIKNLLNEKLLVIAKSLDLRRSIKWSDGVYRDRPDLTKARALKRLVRQSHGNPEVTMEVIDDLLGTFGVESLDFEPDNFRKNPDYLYCNTGDTYAGTVLYSFSQRKYFLWNWGDVVEAEEKERGI